MKACINALTNNHTAYCPNGGLLGKLLLIYICNFHVLSYLLLIYIYKLHWNCSNGGLLELREAIVQSYNTKFQTTTTVDNVIVTSGSMLSLYSILLTILKPGDECLLPLPGFPNYQQSVSLAHGRPVNQTET